MTTSAQIRTNWQSYVFEHSSILAITSKAFAYELTQESEKEVGAGYDNSDINFFEYVIHRPEVNYNLVGGGSASNALQIFSVEVRYSKYAGTDGAAYNDCVDAMETLTDVVRDSLGSTWQGLVDFVQSPIEIEAPTLQKFNETDCFRTTARFLATKQI